MSEIPIKLIQMIKNGGNPQQLVLSMLEEGAAASNPIISNLIELAKNKDDANIEKFARNYFAERGMDFDKEFNAFKQSFK